MPESKDYKRYLRIAIIVAVVLACLGIAIRIVDYIKLYHATKKMAQTQVATVKAKPLNEMEEIILPGNVLAWHEATIYARTNGYVEQWLTDVGAHVKSGDLLAVISTPEVDQELKQAEADLKTAEANNQLAQITAKRWLHLWQTLSVSKQETDEKVSDAKAKAAIEVATRANRDRLHDLVSYEKVVAPFDGIIMSRNTDIGKLINAGSSSLKPLFQIVQSDKLRIYVRVPQHYSARVNDNMIGELHFSEHPGKVYQAKLLSTAQALENGSRTLLVQLEIDNPTQELLPGAYAQVHLKFPHLQGSVLLPVNTLIFRAQGLQVAIIPPNSNKVDLKSITLGRDYGDNVEVVNGVTAEENVVVNPPDAIMNGQEVKLS